MNRTFSILILVITIWDSLLGHMCVQIGHHTIPFTIPFFVTSVLCSIIGVVAVVANKQLVVVAQYVFYVISVILFFFAFNNISRGDSEVQRMSLAGGIGPILLSGMGLVIYSSIKSFRKSNKLLAIISHQLHSVNTELCSAESNQVQVTASHCTKDEISSIKRRRLRSIFSRIFLIIILVVVTVLYANVAFRWDTEYVRREYNVEDIVDYPLSENDWWMSPKQRLILLRNTIANEKSPYLSVGNIEENQKNKNLIVVNTRPIHRDIEILLDTYRNKLRYKSRDKTAWPSDLDRKDDNTLQGSWKVISWQENNRPDHAKMGTILEFVFGQSTIFGKRQYYLNARKKPKMIDFYNEDKCLYGIYVITDDTLEIAVCGWCRPESFKPEDNGPYDVRTNIILERVNSAE
jgi:uncharacterized protein (TIGR03067 family)